MISFKFMNFNYIVVLCLNFLFVFKRSFYLNSAFNALFLMLDVYFDLEDQNIHAHYHLQIFESLPSS